jgi:hypothetical protein
MESKALYGFINCLVAVISVVLVGGGSGVSCSQEFRSFKYAD